MYLEMVTGSLYEPEDLENLGLKRADIYYGGLLLFEKGNQRFLMKEKDGAYQLYLKFIEKE